MEIRWLGADLVEVKGARDDDEAKRFVEQETGHDVKRVTHIVTGLHQVQVK